VDIVDGVETDHSRMIEHERGGDETIGLVELVEDGCILASGRRPRFRLE